MREILLFGALLAAVTVQSVLPLKTSETSFSMVTDFSVINFRIKGANVAISIEREDGTKMQSILHARNLGLGKQTTLITPCGPDRVCISTNNYTHTAILARPEGTLEISRKSATPNVEFIDCHDLSDAQWVGGPQQRYQHWPIQHMYYEEEPYVPSHPINMAVTERYWLSSKGFFIYVYKKTPLFLDQNNYKDNNLCLIAKTKEPYRPRDNFTMTYLIGIYPNAREAHEMGILFLGKPRGRPDYRMVQHPIWSTWARYKVDVNEEVVLRFADEITSNNFNNSQLEIDDNWETCYGSAVFDPVKFPNVTRLTRELKKRGFRVTLWIHPFINEKCEPAYSTALNNSYFVRNLQGQVHMSWWQGANAATIDFTNPKAVQWWVARLKKLEAQGIDSFKFDAGETSWLPQISNLTGPLSQQPGIFTQEYVKTLAKNFNGMIEARVGWKSQDLPIFVRMIDKDSRWTWNNGLPTLITTLLQMNLNGYSFVLPDMIGGNGYVNNMLNSTEIPPKELFIRWLQANVFMPSLQYSFVPWDFDAETIALARKFTKLHADVSPIIWELMNKTVATGAPLNPPIWWVDPTNQEAHKIKDEFLLGEKILVAPVIEEGAISRDIYLPAGKWQDKNTQKTYTGPVWLRDYPAPLDVLPYFQKL